MKKIHGMWSQLAGRNSKFTPKEVVVDQLNEARPLPMGRAEFEVWANRIIAGAVIPGGEEDSQAFIDSQKFALCNMLMHLGPTESHKPDAHFIHSMRKHAINQVADTIRREIQESVKARLAAKEQADKAHLELVPNE